MNIVLLGLPGSGKGTQSKLLQSNLDFFHFSTGDMLRANSDNEEIKKYLDKGQLVPIELILSLLSNTLSSNDKNVVFDGLPRDINQAVLLDSYLKNLDMKVDLAIGLSVPEESVINRILQRVVCGSCGFVYSNTSGLENCEKCKAKLIKRSDDNRETVGDRIKLYNSETNCLKEFYRKKSVYREINGFRPVKQVHEDILELIRSEI